MGRKDGKNEKLEFDLKQVRTYEEDIDRKQEGSSFFLDSNIAPLSPKHWQFTYLK
jgi:hypothetical protein